MTSRPALILIALTLLVSALMPSTAIHSQDGSDADYPPAVIDVFPSGTVELLPADTLTVTFDQPMDRASVEAAFKLQPDLPGLLLWSDAQTLTFTPNNGFPIQKNYTLTIAESARALNGKTLERPYTTDLRTLGTLNIATFSPADGTKTVDRNVQLVVGFTRPMLAISTAEDLQNGPMPFNIAPAIYGKGEWVNTSMYVFTPSTPLPTSTDYTVTLLPGLKSADGAALDPAATTVYRFRTAPPQVVSILPIGREIPAGQSQNPQYDPKNVPPDATFEITFSDPVSDRPNLESQFSMTDKDGQNVVGAFEWRDATKVWFTPTYPLDRGEPYTLKVATDGERAEAKTSITGLAPFAVINRFTQDTLTYYPGSNIRVDFNAPFSPVTVVDNVLVSVNGEPPRVAPYKVNEYNFQSLFLDLDSIGVNGNIIGARYTITIKAGVTDRYGMELGKDYTLSFTLIQQEVENPAQKQPIPVVNGDLMQFPTYRGAPRMPFNYTGAPIKFPLSLYRMPPDQVGARAFSNFQYFSDGESQAGYGWSLYSPSGRTFCDMPTAVQPGNLTRSWQQDFTKPESATAPNITTFGETLVQEVPLTDADGKALPLGMYWITAGENQPCVVYNAEFQGYGTSKDKTAPAYQFGVAVTNAGITLKRGPDSAFVLVTDLITGQPIPDLDVTLYADGQAIGTAKSGADGTATLPVRYTEHRFILVTAAGKRASTQDNGDVYGVWYHNWYSSGWRDFRSARNDWGGYFLNDPLGAQGYLYTDRPIYRPGDTVYYRGVLREKRDVQFPVSAKRTAWVSIGSGYSDDNYYAYSGEVNRGATLSGDQVYINRQQITLDDYGAFSGTFVIPADAPLRDIAIVASLTDPAIPVDPNNYRAGQKNANENAGVAFTVAEYRVPEFTVAARTDQPSIIQGDPLTATFNANYYFGGAVSSAEIRWSVSAQPTYFNYTGAGYYNFVDWRSLYRAYYYDYYQTSQMDQDTTTTNGGGQAVITSTKTTIRAADDQSVLVQRPYILTLTGTATDESGLPVGANIDVIAHPADLYAGISADRYAVAARSPITFNLIAIRPDSTPIRDQKLTVEVFTCKWDTGAFVGERLGDATTVTTDKDGKASVTRTFDKGGYYCATVSGTDSKGRRNSALLSVWVTDKGTASWFTRASSDYDESGFVLLTDRPSYSAGDTATVLVPNPFVEKSTLLLTVERAGVLSHQVLTAEGGKPFTAQVPITDAMAPNMFITATFLQGRTGDKARPILQTTAELPVTVSSDARKLNIALKTAQSEIKPGTNVQFDVVVTDSAGKPVPNAQVGLKLVDKAVLDLLPDNSATLFETFFRSQGYYTQTEVSLYALLEPGAEWRMGGPPGLGGGGGGGGLPPPPIRQDYQTTPLWKPDVITDDQGRAQVSVAMPDNLTTFRLDARAITLGADLKVGSAKLDVISTLPLIVRPVTPRFVTMGDRLELAAVINNNTGTAQEVTASIAANGVTLENAGDQIVNIPAGGRARVAWPATVLDVPGLDLTFTAIGQNGAQDAAKPALRTGPGDTIPVHKFIARDAPVATGGVLREGGSASERIALPPRLNTGNGELTVRLDPSLTAALPDSFRYLQQFPYFCIEQTVSRFLPNIVTVQALRTYGDGNVDPALQTGLDTAFRAALDKLQKEQKDDGGWGWYPTMQVDPLTTAYAAYGLIAAREAGYSIDAGMIERAVSYVRRQIVDPLSLQNWQLSRQAFYLFVLSQEQSLFTESDKARFAAMFAVKSRLSIAGRAFLLMAYTNRFPDDANIATLRDNLISSATITANGTYWSENKGEWRNWGTDTRTTALALAALVQVVPTSDLLPNVARWLVSMRQIDSWATTQETTWSLIGLTRYAIATGELKGQYDYNVRLNRASLLTGSVTSATLREDKTVVIALKDLAALSNRLIITRQDGPGVLYYTARLTTESPADQLRAFSRGIRIQREYFTSDGTQPIPAGQSIKVGDRVTVRLSLLVDNDLTYFALEDGIPAGAEPLDPQLLTTASDPNNVRFRRTDSRWYYGWWYFQQVEVRDSGIHLYADYLPAGSYTFTYQVQAVIPGVYQVLPTVGYGFYATDFYGRSEGALLTITP